MWNLTFILFVCLFLYQYVPFLQSKIQIQLKARSALEEILELYSQKPELGSADAMEDSRSQIDEITQTLDKLQEQLYKYQVRFYYRDISSVSWEDNL